MRENDYKTLPRFNYIAKQCFFHLADSKLRTIALPQNTVGLCVRVSSMQFHDTLTTERQICKGENRADTQTYTRSLPHACPCASRVCRSVAFYLFVQRPGGREGRGKPDKLSKFPADRFSRNRGVTRVSGLSRRQPTCRLFLEL